MSAPEPQRGDRAPEVRLIPGAFPLTDSGNAERFAARNRGEVHWLDGRKQWLIWSGELWDARIGAEEIHARIKVTVRAIDQEADDCGDENTVKAIRAWSMKSEGMGKLSAIRALAAAEPGIPIDVDDLDRDPWLLNCTNGTLDLRSGKLGPHRPEDLITKSTRVRYVRGCKSDTWDAVLHNMTGGDWELEAYLRRVAGYSLTGSAREKRFFFLHGPPDAGKSSFILALLTCMGDYAESTQFETWTQRFGGPASNRDDLVELRGVRLVTAGEVARNAKWDTALLKQITGGDRIKAQAKYEKPISFQATCTLILAANDAPRAPDDDDGFWSRMQRIPITNIVPKDKRIPNFAEVLARPENAEAILAWAVEGCLEWQKDGIGTARVVEESTTEYRADNDWLSGFLELFELEETASIPAPNFRDLYERYCKQEGQHAEPTKTLSQRIARRHPTVRYKKVHGARAWYGLRLRSGSGASDEEIEEMNRQRGPSQQSLPGYDGDIPEDMPPSERFR